MKIAMITDTHFGCRKNSVFFMEEQKNYYDNIFFPFLEEQGITTIFHLGDFFDNRKTVNFETLRHSKECFIHPIRDRGYELHMLVGNHDHYYKSSGELSSTKLLFSGEKNVHVYNSLTRLKFGNTTFLMVPWIFPIQEEEITNIIRTDTSDVCCGHFEMIDVVYQGTTVSKKGIDPDTFKHFNHTFSGHYHKKSQFYIGSPYEMTWSDFDDSKRIIVFDADEGSSESVFFDNTTFRTIEYPKDEELDLTEFKRKIVRVLVKQKDDLKAFNDFIERLQSVGPQEVDIKEEYLYLDVLEEDDLDDDTDTLGVLLSSIDNIEDLKKGEKVFVKEILKQLYEKASETK